MSRAEREKAERQRVWMTQILMSAQQKRWYGMITVKIEDGLIKRVVKAESLVPPS